MILSQLTARGTICSHYSQEEAEEAVERSLMTAPSVHYGLLVTRVDLEIMLGLSILSQSPQALLNLGRPPLVPTSSLGSHRAYSEQSLISRPIMRLLLGSLQGAGFYFQQLNGLN